MIGRPDPLGQKLREQLSNYVYALCDPCDENKIFYIGLGQGDRVLQHEWEVLDGRIRSPKERKIDDILKAGMAVEKIILRHGLTRDQAEAIEATLIDALPHFGLALSNLVRGARTGSGLRRLADLIRESNAAPLVVDGPTVIVNINNTWNPGVCGDDLWDMSRSWWRARPDKRSPKPTLLLAVAHQIVRGAWALDPDQLGQELRPKWEELGSIKQQVFYHDNEAEFKPFRRWRFDGTALHPEQAARYLDRSFTFPPRVAFQYLTPSGTAES